MDEARRIPKGILECDRWWLRSPGNRDHSVAYVSHAGVIDVGGFRVQVLAAVRPALVIPNLKSANLNIGDELRINTERFVVVSDTLVLCMDAVKDINGKKMITPFRADYTAIDANEYKASDVKKVVDEWFEELKNQSNLQKIIESYGAKVNAISKARGVNVTQYEIELDHNYKQKEFVNLF